MTLKRTYLFITISSIALLMVLIIQVSWILQSAQIKERLFNEKANMILSRTTEALRADNETCRKIEVCAEKESATAEVVSLGQNETQKIDSLFSYYMKFYNIHIDYTFEIRKPGSLTSTDEIGLTNYTYNKPLDDTHGSAGIDLKLILPEKKQFILAEMGSLFITSKFLKEDKLKGYGLGADDYITKPFDEEELQWKIKAVIRRIPEIESENKINVVSIGKYTFDFQNQSLTINGNSKRITEKECDILNYLSARRNKVIKREDLLKDLWGENDYFFGRSLDVFITKIRKYLKEDTTLSIENVFGVGFVFNVPGE